MVGRAVEDSAIDTVEEVETNDDSIDGLDVRGEERFVLQEVGGRHGVEVGRRCRVTHVEGAGGVDEALFKAFERKGGVLEVVKRDEDETVLEDDGVVEVDLLAGKEGNGGVQFCGVPDSDGGRVGTS